MTNQLEKIKNSTSQSDLSKLLKRKRLEMGLKLEDLSQGICSSSYLSRIENSVVEANQSYYKALFERMNINYDNLKKERSRNLYQEILQAYFRRNFELIDDIVNHALSCNNYADTEIELMVLFYNIITKRFNEARDAIIKLEDLSESFSSNELLFYLYSCCFYSYLTNQNVKAYQQILVLISVDYDDLFFESCVYDLAIKIMYSVGQMTLALRCYHKFEKISRMPLFNLALSLNRMLVLTIDSTIDQQKTFNLYFRISNYLNLDDDEIKEKNLYYLGVLYFYNNQFVELYELLINKTLSARIMTLLLQVIFHIHDEEITTKILNKALAFNYSKYEKLYKDYALYCKMLFDGESDYVLFNYLRNILIVKSNFYDHFLQKIIELEYIERALSSSKYKEGLRFAERNLSISLHEKLK